MDTDSRTVWCGNISDKVTEDLLFELFLQVAPVEKVRIPTDREGRKSNFAFITFKHDQSVDYAVQLLNGISLFDRRLNIKPRNNNGQNNIQRNNEQEQQQALQKHFNLVNCNDLMKFGEMMQLSYSQYNQPNYNNSNWHIRREQNNFRDREDHRKDDYKPYRQHDNRHNGPHSPHSNNRDNRNYNQRDRRHRQYGRNSASS